LQTPEQKLAPETLIPLETLIAELSHRVWEVRRDACEELGQRGDVRAIPELVGKLHDSVGAVRFAAAEALGRLGDRSVIPHLVKLLYEQDFGAYAPVIDALANLRAVEAVPIFILLLGDPDARARGMAANALMVITRQVIPFKAKGTDAEREAAIARWQAWWEKNKQNYVTE